MTETLAQHPLPEAESATESESVAFGELALTLIPVILTSLASVWMMSFVYSFPQIDSIDVVGLSLLGGYKGYSEQAEKNAFHALIGSALVFGPLAAWCIRRLPRQAIKPLGIASLWGLSLFFVGTATDVQFVRLCAVVAGLMLVGHVVIWTKLNRNANQLSGWCLAVFGWGCLEAMFHSITWPFLIIFVVIVVLTGIGLTSFQRSNPDSFSPAFRGITAVTVVVLFIGNMWTHGEFNELVVLSTFIVIYPDMIGNLLRRRFRNQLNLWFQATVLALVLKLTAMLPDSVAADFEFTLRGLVYALLLLLGGIREWVILENFKKQRGIIDAGQRRISQAFNAKWFAPIAILPAVVCSGGFALLLSVLIGAIKWCENRSRPGWTRGMLLACGVGIACWPSSPFFAPTERDRIDEFHDGQVMSAIWELENGRRLVSEVFPLRGAHVCLGWIGRRLLGPTMQSATFLMGFSIPISAAGACLIAYAWTRSAYASLFSALALLVSMPVHQFGIREAILLVVIGLALEILRCRQLRWYCLLIPLSFVPFVSGFDLTVPYLAACGCAITVDAFRYFSIKKLLHRLILALIVVAFSSGIFMGFLVAIADQDAAIGYWAILWDYARNYNALFGLPIAHHLREEAFVQYALIGIVWFTAGGAILWKRMNRPRRRLWVFLLVTATIYSYKAIGRSDSSHIGEAAVPIIVLWTLMIHDILREISRHRLQRSPQRISLTFQCFIVVVAWQSPLGWTNPVSFFRQLSDFPTSETVLRKSDALISSLVRPDQFLWPIENGIVNIEQQRHNPTRHAIAYCIGSLSEQRRAVKDLDRNSTPVILWSWKDIDHVDGPPRQWIIATHILRKYQPGGTTLPPYSEPYLIPIGSDWRGIDSVPEPFLSSFSLRRLPSIWGELRWPQLSERVKAKRVCFPWEPIDSPPEALTQSRVCIAGEVNPRNWNYLLLEIAVESSSTIETPWPGVILEFSNGEKFTDQCQISWECVPDRQRHLYLIPIGCHPGWTWGTQIRKLRLTTEGGRFFSLRAAEIYEIDEVD